MKNSLNNREYLRRWYNIPALLLAAFVFLTMAEKIATRRKRKTVKKWHNAMIERVAKK